jgi:aminobenzoyl-glutamate transport protein
VTPLNQYLPLIPGFAARYALNTGIGTLIALMLPYSLAFLVAWTLMLIAWIPAGLPVGPGAGFYLPPQ